MIKSIKMMKSKHNCKLGRMLSSAFSFVVSPAGITRRAVLAFSLIIMAAGNVWGQTWQERDAFNGETVTLYAKDNLTEYPNDFYLIVKEHLGEITSTNIYVRWDLYDTSKSEYITFDKYNTSFPQISFPEDVYQYKNSNGSNSGKYIVCYKAWTDFDVQKIFNPLLKCNGLSLKNCILECYVTNEYTTSNISNGNIELEPGFKLKIQVVFNEDGVKPDDFVTKFEGESVSKEYEVAANIESAMLDFSDLLSNKYTYARFYLTKNESTIDDDTNINCISINGDVQHSTERKDRGYYMYNGSGLTAENLKVSVNLPAGSFYDYQLVALFSDEIPQTSESVITKEPNIDTKIVYNFTRPFAGTIADGAKIYNKQLLVPSGSSCDIILSKYLDNICADYQVSSKEDLIQNLYLRWYITTSDGKNISNPENYLKPLNKGDGNPTVHKKKIGYGYYWSSSLNKNQWGTQIDYASNINSILNIQFLTNLADNADDLKNYQIHVVLSNEAAATNGQIVSGSELLVEPQKFNMEYVFSFISPKVIDKYLKWDLSTAKFDVSDLPKQLDTNLGVLKNSYSIKWYVQDGNGNKQTLKTEQDAGDSFWAFKTVNASDLGPYSSETDANVLSVANKAYYDLEQDWETGKVGVPTISCPKNNTFENYPGYTVVCEATSEFDGTLHAVKYIFHFNEKGIEVDPFEGNLATDGTEEELEKEINAAATTVEIDFSTALGEGKSAKYARFYLIDKEGLLYNGSASAISVTDGMETDQPRRGLYVYKDGADLSVDNLKVKITLPAEAGSFFDYRLVAVISAKTPTVVDGKVTKDPEIDAKVTYSFKRAFTFVHSKGASGRDFITKDNDKRINGTVQQYAWDGEVPGDNGRVVKAGGDIRQGVHTVEYNVYVDPNSDSPVVLHLPFQDYLGSGNSLEPNAYIRWYDWNTDLQHSRLNKVGTLLNELIEQDDNGVEKNRGFFMLNCTTKAGKPIHNAVGVTFKPKDFNGVTVIACDVSKYFDGIYADEKGASYLVHEPTISTRYIFTIRPASVIAGAIADGKKKFDAGGSDRFTLVEDNGRVCVSIKDENTSLSVRAAMQKLTDYYIYDNSNNLVNCTNLKWVPYYEDEKGKLWKCENAFYYETGRIKAFTVNELCKTYTSLDDGGKTKQISGINDVIGSRFHMVGMLKGGNTEVEAIHYELNFIKAPAYWSRNIPDNRKAAYLEKHMDLQASLKFDDKVFGELSTELNNWSDNHVHKPLEWNEAEYGFCYESLENYRIGTDFSGLSPIHGDYLILKTMNHKGVSESNASGNGRLQYKWYNSKELEDYTYRFGGEKKYGGFLYVDASDESRVITKLKFNADLCAGSELCYTAVIADMTESGKTPPRIMATVYAIKNGKKEQLVSFISCDLKSVISDSKSASTDTGTTQNDDGYQHGTWYQVYGRIAVPNNIDLSDPDYGQYEVDIINYAPNTEGADYCIDEINFYTKNAKVNLYQKTADCDEQDMRLNLYIDTDAMANMGQNKKIYWRICDEDGNPLPADIYKNNGYEYGETEIGNMTADNIPTLEDFVDSDAKSGYFTGTYGKVWFSIANGNFPLKPGHQYYISVCNLGTTPADDTWGNADNKCSIYSRLFFPMRSYISMHDAKGDVVTSVVGDCSSGKANIDLRAVINIPDETQPSGFRQQGDVKFDFFLGTEKNYTENLQKALEDYRNNNPAVVGLAESYNNTNSANYGILKKAVEDGSLLLSCSDNLKCTITNDNRTIVAIPVTKAIDEATKTTYICDYYEFTFKVDASGNGPTLQLGFEGVNYPEDYVRVVRIGKEQMDNLQKTDDGFLLHVPVNTFNTKGSAGTTGDEKIGTLAIVGDLELLKEETTDPTVTRNVEKVATFVKPTVSGKKMYISLNFHGEGVTKQTFKEGFAYKMFFQVANAKDDGTPDESGCNGNVEFVLKVVPEFVTWTGNADATNTNWNNDKNWTRSKCEELYKKEGQNTASPEHNDDNEYADNDDKLGQPDTYVPMKFTYVTLPSKKRAPDLIGLTKDGNDIYNNVGETATTNIQYDMLVRYSEKECQGGEHHTEVTDPANIYDCEKFYGNTCKEIYFKPEAELVNQQHLVYEKAWVEKELKPNTWYLMASPLKATYAGDMYVPYANGRQETEAFQPITFSTDNGYSRTKYPIYQRSWKTDGATVYTKTDDARQPSYSANLPFASKVKSTMTEWSHTYNDVQVAYSAMTGFSIRAHKEDQASDALALLRLPKADTQYDYYEGDNTTPADNKLNHPVSKTKTETEGVVYAQLMTGAKSSETTENTGEIAVSVKDMQENGGYVLVGNPYMSSIKMSEFFKENAGLTEKSYWTYEGNEPKTFVGEKGTIRPLQAFFIKVPSEVTEIKFTTAMMTDGNTALEAAGSEASGASVKMTASGRRGQSSATVVQNGSADAGYAAGEDVEALFDSNLADVPVIYTVAGTQAVAINSVPTVDVVPFGVTCADGDDVEVTVTGTDMVGGTLYVYDAAEGTSSEVSEGETISVQPNVYGRYYLTTRSSMGIDGSVVNDVIISVRDRQVNITSPAEIGSVRVMTLDGSTAYIRSDCGTSATFSLMPGVYIVETDGSAGRKTVKVMVR